MSHFTLVLPFPTVAMGSNGRVHYMARAMMRKTAKQEGVILARQVLGGGPSPFQHTDKLRALITFLPPTKRRRDLDNVFSGMKAHMDGVFEVLGLDDSRLERVTLQWGNDADPNRGEVVVTLSSDRGAGRAQG